MQTWCAHMPAPVMTRCRPHLGVPFPLRHGHADGACQGVEAEPAPGGVAVQRVGRVRGPVDPEVCGPQAHGMGERVQAFKLRQRKGAGSVQQVAYTGGLWDSGNPASGTSGRQGL